MQRGALRVAQGTGWRSDDDYLDVVCNERMDLVSICVL